MGQEIPCSVRLGDKQANGKALLETNEIIFRGDLRLKIPLAAVKSVSSRDGELYLKWSGSAIFQIGKYADTWARKILHPKSTIEKLGVKTGMAISALGIRDAAFVQDLTDNAARFSATKAIKNSDLIFLAADDVTTLSRIQNTAKSLADTGALWIVYPKGRKDIKERDVLDAGRTAGLVDVKVVSFSATHTALKFVCPKAKRPARLSTRRA